MECPHCGNNLKISEKAKLTIVRLAPDKILKVKCVGCGEFFGVNRAGETVRSVEDGGREEVSRSQARQSRIVAADGRKTGKVVKPPGPPDLGWLKDGIWDDGEVVEEIPLALVLMRESDALTSVIRAIEGLGYRAEVAASSAEAIEKMQFVSYSNVVLHSQFDGAGIQTSSFHNYMSRMDMSKRRYIFYTLIGPEFKTLYNLQALVYSANLVVNDNEVNDFNIILRKVIPEYEQLFGPLMEELHIQKK